MNLFERVLLGPRGRRSNALYEALGSGALSFIIGYPLTRVLPPTIDLGGELPLQSSGVVMLIVAIMMGWMYRRFMEQELAFAILYGAGCGLMFLGGFTLQHEVPNAYGLTVQWSLPFFIGLWCAYGALASIKSGEPQKKTAP